ncbi:mitochondrial ribosomal small subunit component [Parahypoxylon ruwenzoriense]
MQPTRALLKGRSVWKDQSRSLTLFENHLNSLPIVRPAPGERVKPIRTQARAATILPSFVGLKFQVYNGKDYYDVEITEQMVGHKLGEFSPYYEKTLHLGEKVEECDRYDEVWAYPGALGNRNDFSSCMLRIGV